MSVNDVVIAAACFFTSPLRIQYQPSESVTIVTVLTAAMACAKRSTVLRVSSGNSA